MPLNSQESFGWLWLSITMTLLLGFSFSQLRIREVRCAYTNTVIAVGLIKAGWLKTGSNVDDKSANNDND
jgi:hypothetical protein